MLCLVIVLPTDISTSTLSIRIQMFPRIFGQTNDKVKRYSKEGGILCTESRDSSYETVLRCVLSRPGYCWQVDMDTHQFSVWTPVSRAGCTGRVTSGDPVNTKLLLATYHAKNTPYSLHYCAVHDLYTVSVSLTLCEYCEQGAKYKYVKHH